MQDVDLQRKRDKHREREIVKNRQRQKERGRQMETMKDTDIHIHIHKETERKLCGFYKAFLQRMQGTNIRSIMSVHLLWKSMPLPHWTESLQWSCKWFTLSVVHHGPLPLQSGVLEGKHTVTNSFLPPRQPKWPNNHIIATWEISHWRLNSAGLSLILC